MDVSLVLNMLYVCVAYFCACANTATQAIPREGQKIAKQEDFQTRHQ